MIVWGNAVLTSSNCTCLQGGRAWEQVRDFYKHMYDCASFEESASRTVDAIKQVAEQNASVVVAHNGPRHLGSAPEDICGVDFMRDEVTKEPTGGDWGDLDLHEALQTPVGRCAPDMLHRVMSCPSL